MKLLYLLLSAAGLAGTILSSIQFVMAIRYQEWGRVIVYFFLAAVCLEVLIAAVLRLRRRKGSPENAEETL